MVQYYDDFSLSKKKVVSQGELGLFRQCHTQLGLKEAVIGTMEIE